MGEYAMHQGQEIKIGTCEDMLYLRWEDRYQVQPLRGNVDPGVDTGLRFRLPFPDEDHLSPGYYTDAFRGQRLYNGAGDWLGVPEMETKPGMMQIHHQASGLLLNLPCFHGMRLPDLGPDVRVFQHGGGHAFELTSVKAMGDGTVVPVVTCRHCRSAWRATWDEIWDHIPDPLRQRLAVHRQPAAVEA